MGRCVHDTHAVTLQQSHKASSVEWVLATVILKTTSANHTMHVWVPQQTPGDHVVIGDALIRGSLQVHVKAGPWLCAHLSTVHLLQGLPLPVEAVTVIRKSFDARAKHRDFAYVVDVDAEAARAAGARPRFKPGQLERSRTNLAYMCNSSPPLLHKLCGDAVCAACSQLRCGCKEHLGMFLKICHTRSTCSA